MERRAILPDEGESLVRFVHLKISFDDLMQSTNGMLELHFGPTQRRFTSHFLLVEPGVKIEKTDIERAIAMCRDGTLSERDLIRWATMLLLNDAYVWGPGEDLDWDDEIGDALNDLSLGGLALYLNSRER